MKEYKLSDGENHIFVQIKHSSRKTMALEVRGDGSVYARVPMRVSGQKVISFIEDHKTWIFAKLALAKDRESKKQEVKIPVWESLTKAERDQIKQKFIKKVQYYSQKMQIDYGTVTIRNQKTRWGSCSQTGNLNFNYRLSYLPENLLDYVVVHELSHRFYMNHSPLFWKTVEVYCPNYIQCRKQLGMYKI